VKTVMSRLAIAIVCWPSPAAIGAAIAVAGKTDSSVSAS
jgi:hypothetical protein